MALARPVSAQAACAHVNVYEFRGRWHLLLGCAVAQGLGVQALVPFTTGLFIVPLHDALGWSRTTVSAGVTIATLGTALFAPIVGILALQTDCRRLIVFGLVGLALCYCVLALAPASVGLFWISMAAMSLLAAGCTPVTVSAVLVANYRRRRGTALGLALVGTGVSSLLVPGAVGRAIEFAGWRGGFGLLTILAVIGAIACALLIDRRAPHIGRIEEGALEREQASVLWPRPSKVMLPSAFLCIALATGGTVVHFTAMLVDGGWTSSSAAQGAAVLGLSLVVGRIVTGVLIDHIDAALVAAAFSGTSCIGFVVMAASNALSPLVAAPLVGLSLGAELDLMAFLAARHVGQRWFGPVFGFLYALFLIGVGVSPTIYAILRERSGSYAGAYVCSAVLLGIAALLFLALARRQAAS